MNEIPKELDWISIRSKCSLSVMFELLKSQVETDIAKQNEIPGHPQFSMGFSPASFTVLNHTIEGIRAVVFALTKTHIEIKNAERQILFQASLTINDSGECRLKVDDKELELWQIRKRALEELFFGGVLGS